MKFVEGWETPLLDRQGDLAARGVDGYLAAGGMAGLGGPAAGGLLEAVLQVEASGLTERVLGGRPVHAAWRKLLPHTRDIVLMADAREADPQSLNVRTLLGRDMYGLFEGLYGAASLCDSPRILVFLPPVLAHLEPLIREVHAEFMNQRVLGGKNPGLQVISGEAAPPAREGEKRLVHAVETWHHLGLIFREGAERFRARGKRGQGGTRLFTLIAPGSNPRLLEIPAGSTLREILEPAGLAEKAAGSLALALDGGLGGFWPPANLDLPLIPAHLLANGLAPSPGSLHLLDDKHCLVDLSRRALMQVERVGEEFGRRAQQLTLHSLRLVTELRLRRGAPAVLIQLEALARSLADLRAPSAWPLYSSLKHFRAEWERHAEGRPCLVIDPERPQPAPCQAACPAGIDIPSFLALVGQGRHREAVEIIRRDNPLPYICGLVCPAPCEKPCIRGERDQPISIRAMKAVAAKGALEAGGYPLPERAPDTGRKAAVIGGGPAGLTAAFFLALNGHQVKLFEAREVMGGTTHLGIPAYRLPREVIRAEVEAIREAGVEILTGKALGRDFTLESLREEGYGAVFLGIGARTGYSLGLPDENSFPGVLDALGFLSRTALGDISRPADEVAVVGGGNSAMDAARTLVRLGCSKVTVVYRRGRDQMPAHDEEVEDAMAEGVEFMFLTAPVALEGENGVISGLRCQKNRLGPPDASGRRRPEPVKGSEFIIPVGAVVAAIGQKAELSCLGPLADRSDVCGRSIQTDPATGRTAVPWLFAGGDAVTGPATVVEAVMAGKWAARAMDAYLMGRELPRAAPQPAPRMRVEPIMVEAARKASLARPEIPKLDPGERSLTFEQAELGLTPEMARAEAERCLRCDICVGCGLCQTVCGEMGAQALVMRGTKQNRLALMDFRHASDRCVGCGSCASVCPTGAIEMRDEEGVRRMSLAGTVISRLKLANCTVCGRPYAPAAYFDWVDEHMDEKLRDSARVMDRVCPDCARPPQTRDIFRKFAGPLMRGGGQVPDHK